MKLQELLKERERIDKELEKYDAEMQRRKELIEWKDRIKNAVEVPMSYFQGKEFIPQNIPDHIKDVLVNALQVEIDKLEKE